MGTFAAAKPVPSATRLFTAADVAVMPETLPSGSVSYELHHGSLVPMSPPGAIHGNLQSRIATELTIQGERLGHGKAFTDVGVVLARKPDHVRGPDVAFVMKASLPEKISPEGFLESIPELIVEIKSKNDTASEIAEKVDDYLGAGAKLVWVCDDANDMFTEHRRGNPARNHGKDDILTCDDIIPGFRLSLAELFRD
jgi:Uma2 family endonuclease